MRDLLVAALPATEFSVMARSTSLTCKQQVFGEVSLQHMRTDRLCLGMKPFHMHLHVSLLAMKKVRNGDCAKFFRLVIPDDLVAIAIELRLGPCT
jgi:hypothetical protein